jgi:SAM-dependent methyltransferase
MLEIARDRAAVAGLPQAEFLEADAQIHAFPAGSYDGLFSRFGVMFFADPQAAFANLRRALKPGGRLTFISWRPLAENPWMTVPLFAALRHLPPPQPPPPGAPGPFAFADPEHVRAILAGAGFGDIALIPLDAKIGGNTIDEAVKLALRVGPLGAMLREYPEAAPRVVDDIRAALEPYAVDGRVTMDAAAWLASARNP